MASSAVDTKQSQWTTRDRPWLVPWNRRLRHLQSIALRNLATDLSESRPRGKATDDEALPGALRSPAKQLAFREDKSLGHSRSSTDLRPIREDAGQLPNGELVQMSSQADQINNKKIKPTPKLRRRITLDWASESPQARQSRLEAVSSERLLDVFFTLHVGDLREPVYISEEVFKSMNPSFRHIDWSLCGPGVTRSEDVRVVFWTRSSSGGDYQRLLEISLNLRSLQFIGKDLAAFNHPFPHNCVVLELTDGFYTCFTDAQAEEAVNPFVNARAKASSPRTPRSTSFDALLRLSKLDDSIQDGLALRDRLASDLAALVETKRDCTEREIRANETRDYVKTIKYARATIEKQVRSLHRAAELKRENLKRRRDLLSSGRLEINQGLSSLSSLQTEVKSCRSSLLMTSKAIASQRRRISHDLASIYPIRPTPSDPLSFTIRDLPLPDSESLNSIAADTLAASLGHATHMLQQLSFYLSTPLPYPPHPRSSTSSITDPISALTPSTTSTPPIPGFHPSSSSSSDPSTTAPLPPSLSDPQRTFPLYPRASGPRFRFEYALFLLNKDIQVLLADAFALRVLDIRQTLPNLAYVVACMGAGDDDDGGGGGGGGGGVSDALALPGRRRVGTVRGLVRGVSGRGRVAGIAVGGTGVEGRAGGAGEGGTDG